MTGTKATLIDRVFAIYHIMLGWKTCKCYYETDELPNPRPTQPKKKWVKSGLWATFPSAIFSWVGIDFIQERDCTKPKLNQILSKTPYYFEIGMLPAPTCCLWGYDAHMGSFLSHPITLSIRVRKHHPAPAEKTKTWWNWNPYIVSDLWRYSYFRTALHLSLIHIWRCRRRG